MWALASSEQRAPWEWRAAKRHRREGYSDYSGETLERCFAALGKTPAAVAPLPLAGIPATPEPGDRACCRIKCKIGSSGETGSAAYAKTRIDESKGERWFCTEDEARGAGWRTPRG